MNKEQFLLIKKMFSRDVFERGIDYFENNRVRSVSFNRLNNVWFAEVLGREPYYTEVDVNNPLEDGLKAYCDCPAFATYGSCKHVAAVMLELLRRDAFSKREERHYVLERFMEEMISVREKDSTSFLEKLPMHVEYHLAYDYRRKVFLQLRTGVEHRYVVHHVRDLLEDILQGHGHYFTKKFSYDPEQHYFLQKDFELLQIIYEIIRAGDFFFANQYGVNPDYDRREVPILPSLFERLLHELRERDCRFTLHNHTYKQFDIVHDELPSTFMVDLNEKNKLALKVKDSENTAFLPEYRAIFSNGIFYFPKLDQLKVFNNLWNLGLMEKNLQIEEKYKNKFFSEVIPILKDVSQVAVAEEIAEEVVQYPLRATMHLEQREDMIVGKLTYHYGSYTFNPFHPSEVTERIVIRDVAKEEAIMTLIEHSNFRYNGQELYIYVEDDEDVYEFLYHILPLLDERVDLYLTSDIKRLIVDYDASPETRVNIDTGTNLLSIDFDISGVDEEEIDQIIESIIEKKRFYRLKSGSFMSLENEEYGSLRHLFAELNVEKKDIVDGSLSVPVFKGMQVDELLSTKKRYTPTFRKLLHRLKAPEEQIYELPKTLKANLRSYQETGYQWFKSLSEYHLGGILADDMGLGKTIQTITYLLSEERGQTHLIVVPSSVVYNWRNEFNKFAPSLKVAVIAGTKEERQQIIDTSQDVDVWITSYGTLRQDIELYRNFTFHVLILDEAQYIKNYATKTSQAIRQIKAKNRFALTGTPIENSLHELWAIFQVLLPGLLPPQREFNQLSPEKVAQIIRPFILRRLKQDVLKELPDKIESVHMSQLTTEQKKLYLGYLRELQEETAATLATNQFQQNRMKILAGLTRLRQLCCHPSLFIENYNGQSGKLDELMETIESFMNHGKRMLIFSQFTAMHELIIEQLEAKNIDYFYLHGQTPAQERVEMSEAFNAGEKSIFLISLRAGGTGLNLTGADTVILFDLWWNPAVEDQAAGRAHRFGQKKVVQVIRFIAEGTIEERIYELQQKKRELIDKVIQPGETMLSSLSEEDIKQLLNL